MSLTIGLSKILHDIRCFSHQDVVSRYLGVLQVFAIGDELLEKDGFPVLQKIEQSIELCHVSLFSDLSEWALFQLWKLVSFLEDVGHHVFADFDHQNSVVTFSSKS